MERREKRRGERERRRAMDKRGKVCKLVLRHAPWCKKKCIYGEKEKETQTYKKQNACEGGQEE